MHFYFLVTSTVAPSWNLDEVIIFLIYAKFKFQNYYFNILQKKIGKHECGKPDIVVTRSYYGIETSHGEYPW